MIPNKHIAGQFCHVPVSEIYSLAPHWEQGEFFSSVAVSSTRSIPTTLLRWYMEEAQSRRVRDVFWIVACFHPIWHSVFPNGRPSRVTCPFPMRQRGVDPWLDGPCCSHRSIMPQMSELSRQELESSRVLLWTVGYSSFHPFVDPYPYHPAPIPVPIRPPELFMAESCVERRVAHCHLLVDFVYVSEPLQPSVSSYRGVSAARVGGEMFFGGACAVSRPSFPVYPFTNRLESASALTRTQLRATFEQWNIHSANASINSLTEPACGWSSTFFRYRKATRSSRNCFARVVWDPANAIVQVPSRPNLHLARTQDREAWLGFVSQVSYLGRVLYSEH